VISSVEVSIPFYNVTEAGDPGFIDVSDERKNALLKKSAKK
jgi:hypothetical protein